MRTFYFAGAIYFSGQVSNTGESMDPEVGCLSPLEMPGVENKKHENIPRTRQKT